MGVDEKPQESSKVDSINADQAKRAALSIVTWRPLRKAAGALASIGSSAVKCRTWTMNMALRDGWQSSFSLTHVIADFRANKNKYRSNMIFGVLMGAKDADK